ncbi:MAG: MMPL family transporter [Planctomycetes bacterium]|nr:MMPL family transporter [Planctomycetota bacterium]
MFSVLGRFACRRSWVIVGVWAAVLATSATLAPKLPSRLLSGGYDFADSESGRANAALERELGLSASDITAILRSDRYTIDDPEFREAQRRTVEVLEAVEGVRRVLTPESTGDPGRVSADRRAVFLTVSLGTDLDGAQQVFLSLRDALPEQPEGMEIRLTGAPATYAEINEVSERDLVRAETYALPIALLILLVIFRGPIAAGLPVLLGVSCITTNLAVLYLVTFQRPLGIFVLNVTTAVGLGVAIDYSLLVVSRFREELARGLEVDQAVIRTIETAGKAIFFSGLAVVVSLVGLRYVRFVAIHSIGIGGMIVVTISVLGALTLLPALLHLLGRRVNWLTIGVRSGGSGTFWGKIAAGVMRRPLAVFAGILVALFFLVSPLFRIRLGVPGAEILPEGARSREAQEIFDESFPSRKIPQGAVTIECPAGVRSSESVRALREFVRWAREREGVTDVLSIASFIPDGLVPMLRLQYGAASEDELYEKILATPLEKLPPALAGPVRALSTERMTVVRIAMSSTSNDEPARRLTRECREYEWPAGMEVHVGGESGYFSDFIEALYRDFLVAIAVVLFLTYGILLLQFGSFVLPLKAVVMNTFSIAACYGALVFVFQEGHFAGLLGFTATGFVDAPVPVVIFSVLFGLSMDYEVFMLSRVKEAYDRGDSNEESVAHGLAQTGGIITSASAIMIAVSGAFAFADILLVQALGFGMAFAIFLDATVIRAFLVPSTMRLMGDWNWWAPRFARPFLARFSRFAAHE